MGTFGEHLGEHIGIGEEHHWELLGNMREHQNPRKSNLISPSPLTHPTKENG
jgi:hypothetical protein